MLSEWNCKTQQNVLIDVKCNRYVTLKITLSLHILQKNIEIYIYIYILKMLITQQSFYQGLKEE